jgi:pantothenate synthetase
MNKQKEEKENLWQEIVLAEGLNKKISFPFLEDPKQGTGQGNENVKNKELDGSQLLREYNLYKNQRDFAQSGEQEKVQDYVKKIADVFNTNPDIHPYSLNQWHLQQAIDAVSNENLLSKENESKYIDTVGNYILKLKQVEYPEDPNKDLASLRQADEYHWVKSLRDALAQASKPEIRSPEPLKQALSVAKWMQECRNSNLELAQKALDPLTTSEEAKKLLESMHDIEIPSLESKGDQKSANADEAGRKLFDEKIDFEKLIDEIKSKSQDQLLDDSEKHTKRILNHVTQEVEGLIESTSDPRLQNRYREDAVKLVRYMTDIQAKIFQQDKNIQNQWQKLGEFTKQMNSQRWKDAYVQYFTLWIKNSVDGASRGADTFLKEFMRLAKKAV